MRSGVRAVTTGHEGFIPCGELAQRNHEIWRGGGLFGSNLYGAGPHQYSDGILPISGSGAGQTGAGRVRLQLIVDKERNHEGSSRNADVVF